MPWYLVVYKFPKVVLNFENSVTQTQLRYSPINLDWPYLYIRHGQIYSLLKVGNTSKIKKWKILGELFFECTLFLYSVLALFLQYLNIYKTLWWLPKSYWHYSMVFQGKIKAIEKF